MKKIISVLMIAVMIFAFCACGAKEKADGESEKGAVGLANPMVESTPEEIKEKLNVEFNVPERAKNVRYFIIDGKTAQMSFSADGTDYTARIESAEEFTDISGMHYEWTKTDKYEFDTTVAQVSTVKDGEEPAGICLWYIDATKLMYSLSATGVITSGGMLVRMASETYIPVEPDTSAEK